MDAQLVRTGRDRSRIRLGGTRAGVPTEVEVTLGVHEPKRVQLNGAALRSAEALREEIATLVFTPDRLSVVKGGPAVRRAYVDRSLTRVLPARATLPLDYASVLGQRNAVLRRITAGLSPLDALDPWTAQLARVGAELAAARLELVGVLQPGFRDVADELGLADARLEYAPDPLTPERLAARARRDLERGSTGAGPHLDDVGILAAGRDLRAFGSQGEQRVAVLALLLAEAELIADRSPAPPLLLLDDVLSELDRDRRRSLTRRVSAIPQVMMTATSADALPVAPSQLLVVTPGRAEEVR